MQRVEVEVAGEKRIARALFVCDEMAVVVLTPPPKLTVGVRDEIRSRGEKFFVHHVEDVAGRGEELRLTVGRRPVPEPLEIDGDPKPLGSVLDAGARVVQVVSTPVSGGRGAAEIQKSVEEAIALTEEE